MSAYTIGFEIVGHLVVEAANPQAAAAKANSIVARHAKDLHEDGENEYRCPFGRVIDNEKKKLVGASLL